MSANLPILLAEHLVESVLVSRRNYDKRLERCRKGFSAKAVHKLRTETRRILALLHLLEVLQVECRLKKLRKKIKERLDAFDELRDTHVQLKLLKPLWRHHPKARKFKKLLQKREKKLETKLSRRIRKTKNGRINRHLKVLEKLLRSRAARSGSSASPEKPVDAALRKAFQCVATLRRAVRADAPSTIHRMRVAFKKFRYLSELVSPILPGLTRERLQQMTKFQSLAGDVQDWEVLLGTLSEAIACKEIDGAEVETLRSDLRQRRRDAIDLFMEHIDDFKKFDPAHRRGR